MKKIYIIFILTLILCCLTVSCATVSFDTPTESAVSRTADVSSQTTLPASPPTTEPYVSVIMPETTTEQASTIPVTTEAAVTETEAPTAAPETTTVRPAEIETVSVTDKVPEQTTGTAASSEPTSTELSVELPEANGTMEVDVSAENKFIKKVSAAKKIDASLLAAVYSVPASGQNYVLEFYDADDRSKDGLRRVYLLDDNGSITSIAAAKSSEKSNISATENWFCFNVLIKGVIFDAIADQL